jgi:hypothetical protein
VVFHKHRHCLDWNFPPRLSKPQTSPRWPPCSATFTYCFLATGVVRVTDPVVEDTEHVETVLMPLAVVIELVSQGGLLQALHVGSLFFALHALRRL